MPPTPLPKITANFSVLIESISRFPCFTACLAATHANWENLSNLFDSFLPSNSTGSKPLTSAAILTGRSVASNDSITDIPDFPFNAESNDSSIFKPIGVIAPNLLLRLAFPYIYINFCMLKVYEILHIIEDKRYIIK